MNRALVGYIGGLLAGLLLLGATAPELRVQVKEGKLTVYADGAPLYGVLWAISAQTGLQLHILGGAQTTSVPVVEEFTALPMHQGIVRLLQKHLRQANYALITDNKTGALQAVHILAGPAPPAMAAERSAPRPAPAWRPPARDARLAPTEEETAADPVSQAIAAAWTARDPAAHVQALQALGNFQDPRTLEVLQPALQSETAAVRRAALEAMRWGTVSDETALAEVRALATHDPEATVRGAALEVLVRYDDQHPATWALLEKLAAEKGGAYQAFARKELKRLAEEAEARSRPDPQVKSQ